MPFSIPYNEKILIVVRRHPIVLVLELFEMVVAAFLPIGIFVVLQSMDSVANSDPYRQLLILGGVIYYFFIWLISFFMWVDYILDMGIITERRVINIEQRALFNREVSEYFLHNIQDVTVKKIGIMPTFFDYGDLVFSTHGAQTFTLYDVLEPEKIRRRIMELYLKEKE